MGGNISDEALRPGEKQTRNFYGHLDPAVRSWP